MSEDANETERPLSHIAYYIYRAMFDPAAFDKTAFETPQEPEPEPQPGRFIFGKPPPKEREYETTLPLFTRVINEQEEKEIIRLYEQFDRPYFWNIHDPHSLGILAILDTLNILEGIQNV